MTYPQQPHHHHYTPLERRQPNLTPPHLLRSREVVSVTDSTSAALYNVLTHFVTDDYNLCEHLYAGLPDEPHIISADLPAQHLCHACFETAGLDRETRNYGRDSTCTTCGQPEVLLGKAFVVDLSRDPTTTGDFEMYVFVPQCGECRLILEDERSITEGKTNQP